MPTNCFDGKYLSFSWNRKCLKILWTADIFFKKDMIMKEKMCTLRYIAAFSYLPKVRLFEKESKPCYSQHSLAKVFWASINRENNAAKTKLWSLALVTEHYTRGQARLTGQGVWGCIDSETESKSSVALQTEKQYWGFFCAVWLTLMERCFFFLLWVAHHSIYV